MRARPSEPPAELSMHVTTARANEATMHYEERKMGREHENNAVTRGSMSM